MCVCVCSALFLQAQRWHDEKNADGSSNDDGEEEPTAEAFAEPSTFTPLVPFVIFEFERFFAFD